MSDLTPPRGFSRTILLIDAIKEDRAYWVGRLHISSPDAVVLEADTGAAGLAICESQTIDCVVTELNLPDMSGYEVLLKLTWRTPHPRIPVIMLSRAVFAPLAELATQNGAEAFLVKPRASGDQLGIVVDKALAAVALKRRETIHK